MMSFGELMENFKNLSTEDKRIENINNLKFIITFLDEACTKKNISYRKIKSNEIFDLDNGKEVEDDYLEALFVYTSLLKEMVGAYLDKTL